MDAWTLTFDEYVAHRIGDIDRGEFLEAYPLAHLEREYCRELRNTPRDYPLRLDIYHSLPAGVQGELYKFNYTLRERLSVEPREDERINKARATIRRRLAAISKPTPELYRLQNAKRELDEPFTLPRHKLTVAKRYTRDLTS